MASFTSTLTPSIPTQYKVVAWNFRSKRPRKPHFFNNETYAIMYGHSLSNDNKVECVEYFRLVNNKWEKY